MLLVSTVINAQAQRAKTLPMTTAEVLEAEQRLSDLGYWTGTVDGKFDSSTRHALVAFQKVERRQLTGQLTREELTALREAERPTPREGGYAHVEIDITRQVLFVVDADGIVTKVLPVSTGSGAVYTDGGKKHLAHTPRGNFTVYRKINGWRRSTLGLLHYPSYIVSGVAIHGSPSVPTKPASHGCIRIPMYASAEFSSMTPEGTVVLVYDNE
jgi:peptidoglycan hydrolase-like protein with peptidoglycan-binding domain